MLVNKDCALRWVVVAVGGPRKPPAAPLVIPGAVPAFPWLPGREGCPSWCPYPMSQSELEVGGGRLSLISLRRCEAQQQTLSPNPPTHLNLFTAHAARGGLGCLRQGVSSPS